MSRAVRIRSRTSGRPAPKSGNRELRALVISDTHFGAWTGEDILREPDTLALLEPHLDVDEVILLGDMFDFLFGSLTDAFAAAEGLLELLRAKLQGKRFVFLAGNHDHHLVWRETEERLGLTLATGRSAGQLEPALRRPDYFRLLLDRRLAGVEVEIHYPTYMFAGVLCTHGHYLDFHARRTGAASGRLLARLLWAIAVGGEERVPTIEDYEATITLLTATLYTTAQLPNGTHAQRRAFKAFQSLARAIRFGTAPVRAVEQMGDSLADFVGTFAGAHRRTVARPRSTTAGAIETADYGDARSKETERRRRTGAPGGGEVSSGLTRLVSPSDPSSHAIEAFESVVANLGWDRDTDKIVFGHTHQPLDGVAGAGGRVRYWNTGSWIYEPDLSSREAYLDYLRRAWPGTAVLIDSDDAEPRVLWLREHLNPLNRDGYSGEPPHT